MSWARPWLCLCLCLLLLAPCLFGCATSHYDKVREEWTRSDRILKALDMPLHVYATLFSPEFTAAYLDKYAHIFRLTPAGRAAQERQLRQEVAGGYTFLISAASHDWTWVDFERPQSVWRIALVNEAGEQVTPTKIELQRRVTATITELFPYVTEFHHVYTVRFPSVLPDGRPVMPGGQGRLTLLFAGPLGHVELVWRLP